MLLQKARILVGRVHIQSNKIKALIQIKFFHGLLENPLTQTFLNRSIDYINIFRKKKWDDSTASNNKKKKQPKTFPLHLWALCSLSQTVVFGINLKSNRKQSTQEQVKLASSKMPLELKKCLRDFILFQQFKFFPTSSKNEQLKLLYQVFLVKLSYCLYPKYTLLNCS